MDHENYTAFAGNRCLATGTLSDVLLKAKRHLDRDHGRAGSRPVLVFDDSTGRQLDFNFHGTPEEMLAREIPAPRPPGPGRPRLGVVGREVSLLPKHWEWLEAEPNGISAALRRLVDSAMKQNQGTQRARLATEATARFMTVVAGDLPGYEAASRALFAKDGATFAKHIEKWPKDIRLQLERMAARVMG